MITLAVVTKDRIRVYSAKRIAGQKPRPAPAKVQCPRCRVWTSDYCACGVRH